MTLAEEEDVSSECSSGCQSGWTAYLDHSSFESPRPSVNHKAGSFRQEEEDEEEDLSMVSDASSGPPHFHEDDEHSSCFQGCGCLCSPLTPAAGLRKKRRVEPEQRALQQHSSLLDDTASSPLFSYPKTGFDGGNSSASCIKGPLDGVLEFSCGSSATHFKKKYALEKQMGFLQSSAASAKQTPARPVSSRKEGRR